MDLEQGGDRVHRYKGHAVRRNIAKAHGSLENADWALGDDLWRILFEGAGRESRSARKNDLVPHWVAPGACKVQRHVSNFPYNREVEALKQLRRRLAAYPVIFGQPRQEELLTMLNQADISDDQLSEWIIRLAPAERG